MIRPRVLLLGPSRAAISGVVTHVNALLGSPLAGRFELGHFQVGSEGRAEGAAAKLWRLLASPFALAAAILRLDAELVHINSSLNAKAYWRDLAYLVVAKLLGAHVVYQVHGGRLREFGAARPWVLRSMRWPDALVVLSREQLAAFRDLVPQQKIHLVPNGVASIERRGREMSMPGTPLRLLYMGRLARAKGLDETLAALRLARSRGAGVELTLAGSGPEEERLRADRPQGVRFSGPAYGKDKAALLAGADALVLASYSEGLPYALLEAMAAGVVPIVTPVGAIPDVVAHGEHGLIVPPRDAGALASAICRLAGDRALVRRMSVACAHRVAAGYSIERVADDFTAIYSGLLAAHAPRTAL